MDFNLKGICDGLATRYAVATLNAQKPTGAENFRAVYPQAPHSLPSTPALVLMPQDGNAVEAAAATYTVNQTIELLVYFAKRSGDVPRSETQRQLWLPVLLKAGFAVATRDLNGLVKSALPQTWEFLELPYGDVSYDGIKIVHEIIVRDVPVAA